MSHAAGVFSALLSFVSEVSSYYCDGGHYCATAKECCEGGCCYTYPLQRPSPPAQPPYRSINIFVYNHWYFWSVVCALSALAGCAYWAWRRRSRLCGPCRPAAGSGASDHDSAGSIYLPPHYSRCNSFHRAPPPYNEVTSKPDLYPLVITYGDSGDKNCGNYLMVHYFRNYIIRPPRSMSATSTAESMNSSFMCNATNEANILVPPPYSAENLDQWRDDGGREEEAVGESTRPSSIPRSFSTMTYMPSAGHKPISLREDELPDVNTATAHAAVTNWSGLDSPEPIDNSVFRASLIRTASRYAVELDLHKRYKYAAPVKELEPDSDSDGEGLDMIARMGWSPKPFTRENSPSELEVLLSIERERSSMRDELRRERSRARGVNCNDSPPRLSPSEIQTREKQLLAGVEIENPRGRSGLYMPLSRFGRTSTEGAPRLPSASAPTTPSGAAFPSTTLMTLSQRMSGSVFSSRASRMALEESNPLLENEERDHAPQLGGPDDENDDDAF